MLQDAHVQSTDSLFSIVFVGRAATASHQKNSINMYVGPENCNVSGRATHV